MANLLNTIPVRTSQTVYQPNSVQPKNALENLKNPYPQIEKYEYLPAKPIAPARTKTKFTRPLAATGKIINENVWQSATRTVKSYGDYAKNFYNAAFKGEGDDYKVGKINDLSIRAGSLGIASIIATTKFFPFAKGMEFVGLGTWFAAMMVWPKLIGAPIKALTGVDINQKYKDNYGKVKCVFEDNQYRPMDLYRHLDTNGKQLSEKEYYQKYQYDYVYLDKLADKLKIPKDKKNRHEAVMEKMGQVAVQGRTLSMLTAGVMTPVLSSVVADVLQTPVKKTMGYYRENSNLANINKLSNILKKLDRNENMKARESEFALDKVMEELGVEIPKDTMNALSNLLTQEQDISSEQYQKLMQFFDEKAEGTFLKEQFKLYARNNLKLDEVKVSLNNQLYQQLNEAAVKSVKEFVNGLDKELVDKLPEQIKNYSGFTSDNFVEIVRKSAIIKGNDIAGDYKNNKTTELTTEEITSLKDSVIEYVQKTLKESKLKRNTITHITDKIDVNLQEVIKKQQHHNIEPHKNTIVNFLKFIEINKSILSKIEEFEKATIENVSESVTAGNWENVPQKYLEILGFDKQQIAKLATIEPSKASKVVAQKFEEISANNTQYEKVIKEMSKVAAEAIEKEEKAVMTLIGTIGESGVLPKAKAYMAALANKNFGLSDMEKNVDSIYSNQIKKIIYKFRNTTDSFVRPIKALDTFKHISNSVDLIIGHNEQEFKQALKNPHFYMFSNMDYPTAKKSLTEFIKDIVLDKNDINNWTTKMEHDLPNAKKGMKHSKELLVKIANIVNGALDHETALLVDADTNKTVKDFIQDKQYKNAFDRLFRDLGEKIDKVVASKFKLEQIKNEAMSFSQKIDLNNSIMRFRFLNIENELAKDRGNGNICYMKEYFPSETLLKDICKGNKTNLFYLKGWLSELREQMKLEGISEILNVIETVSKANADAIEKGNVYILNDNFPFTQDGIRAKAKTIFGNLDFHTSSKEISEMSGKNITDFFINAAENARSRSKWMKVAYGLLAGTVALTGFVITQIGKDNYFNTSKEEKNTKKKDDVQGASV